MGDMLTLIEQAERAFEADQAEQAAAKLMEGQFTLDDFLEQMQQIKKMGSLGSLMGMMPGMPKELKGAKIDDDDLKPIEAIIRSMTTEERTQPAIINGSRRQRIADGSGTQVGDVNRLVKQFGEMQKMMKKFGMAGAKPTKKGKKGRKGSGPKPGRGLPPGLLDPNAGQRHGPAGPARHAEHARHPAASPAESAPTTCSSRRVPLALRRSHLHPGVSISDGSQVAPHPYRQEEAAAVSHRRGRRSFAA